MGSHPLRTVRSERVTSNREEASRRTAAVKAKRNALADKRPRKFGKECNEQPESNQQRHNSCCGGWRVQCGLDRAVRFVVRRETIVQIITNPGRDSRERDEKENRDQSPHTMSVTKVALRVKRSSCHAHFSNFIFPSASLTWMLGDSVPMPTKGFPCRFMVIPMWCSSAFNAKPSFCALVSWAARSYFGTTA